MKTCPVCLAQFCPKTARQVACSPTCSHEYQRRWVREAYRARVGLPSTWDTPSKPQKQRSTEQPCGHCGVVFKALEQKFCSFRCYLDNRKAVANPADVNAARCLVAPGLTDGQRARLMEKWRRQCRSCSYCPRPATTVDHVLPLILGGTNYEGNLAPCCKSCNSSKGARLLVKWRRSRALVLQGSNPS